MGLHVFGFNQIIADPLLPIPPPFHCYIIVIEKSLWNAHFLDKVVKHINQLILALPSWMYLAKASAGSQLTFPFI